MNLFRQNLTNVMEDSDIFASSRRAEDSHALPPLAIA